MKSGIIMECLHLNIFDLLRIPLFPLVINNGKMGRYLLLNLVIPSLLGKEICKFVLVVCEYFE